MNNLAPIERIWILYILQNAWLSVIATSDVLFIYDLFKIYSPPHDGSETKEKSVSNIQLIYLGVNGKEVWLQAGAASNKMSEKF